VPPRTTEYTGDAPTAYVLSANIKRRHLTVDQQAAVSVRALPLEQEDARKRLVAAGRLGGLLAGRGRPRQDAPAEVSAAIGVAPNGATPIQGSKSTARVAKVAGVSTRRVERAKRVKDADPELFAKVESGEINLSAAEHAVRAKAKREKVQRQRVEAADMPPGATLFVADATKDWEGIPPPDLIVCSPPYGLDKPYNGIADPAIGWPLFMQDWLGQAYAASKPGTRLALNVPLDTTKPTRRATYAETVTAAEVAGWTYAFTIVWSENNVSKSTGRGSVDSAAAPHVMAPVEMVPVFYRETWARKSEMESDLEHDDWLYWTNGLWEFAGESRAWEGHPAPFPEELPRRLILLLSFPRDVVADPFLGSGTTAVAALRLGREIAGFDLSAEYVESARRRVAALGAPR
jgi:site-specific DNA-methyltransferase (adenine-specific)